MTELVGFSWKRAFVRLLIKLRSWAVIAPGVEVELFNAKCLEHRASGRLSRRTSLNTHKSLSKAKRINAHARVTANGTVFVVKVKQETTTGDGRKVGKLRKKELQTVLDPAVRNQTLVQDMPHRLAISGSSENASLFSKQGMKGVNQDAMLVLENFAAQRGTIFCGVFDGHGPDGHLVARMVRDVLPQRIASCWQSFYSTANHGPSLERAAGDPLLITAWKESFVKAHKVMDRELLLLDEVDCVSSGTTAVTLVKQGNDLYIGNVGDSRAVLGMAADDSSLMALQLTIDLKPNLPKEAERIKRLKGRVFALRSEPSVKRVWLPHLNSPGLAMARSFGDYCLKNFGVISEPLITYRKLSVRDRFIVLASDGVWDVLSNEQVVYIVASVSKRSLAARAVVENAARAWRVRRPTSRVDDCTALCFFLDDLTTSSAYKVATDVVKLRKSLSTAVALRRKITIDKAHSSSELELLTISSPSNNTPTMSEGLKKRKLPV